MVPGIATIVALLALAVVVLVFMRVGALHGDTFRLYVIGAEARGVMKGTDVWVGGIKVGKIADIRFRPATADTLQRVVLVLDVLSEFQDYVRRDSWAQIVSGGKLMGTPVVYIETGTRSAPTVRGGDTLQTRRQLDPEDVSSRVAGATKQFPDILRDLKTIVSQVDSIGTGPAADGPERVRVVMGQVSNLSRRALRGGGTVGLVMRDRQVLVDRAQRALARADTLKGWISSGRGVVARYRSDTALLAEVADIRAELAIVQALLDEPRGTAGRALADSVIVRQLTRAKREMSALFADIKRDPLRYISF